MKFKINDIIKRKVDINTTMVAPAGALAIVNGYDSYLRITWIRREEFGNHDQRDGGYNESDFELADNVMSTSKELLLL